MLNDAEPVTEFATHKSSTEGFQRPFVGPAMINTFLDWISQLECGMDLLTQDDYRIP